MTAPAGDTQALEQPTGPPCAGGRNHHPGQPTWCTECAGQITDRLAELPRLIAALEAEAGDVTSLANGDPVSGTRGHPSPSAAVDDVDELTRLLEYWEEAHRELAGRPPRAPLRYGRRAAAAVAYLQTNLADLLAGPLAEEFGRDITRIHTRARRRTGHDTVRTRKPVPCPGCDLRHLIHADGDRYIACQNATCGRLLTFDEYDTWARMLAANTRKTG